MSSKGSGKGSLNGIAFALCEVGGAFFVISCERTEPASEPPESSGLRNGFLADLDRLPRRPPLKVFGDGSDKPKTSSTSDVVGVEVPLVIAEFVAGVDDAYDDIEEGETAFLCKVALRASRAECVPAEEAAAADELLAKIAVTLTSIGYSRASSNWLTLVFDDELASESTSSSSEPDSFSHSDSPSSCSWEIVTAL